MICEELDVIAYHFGTVSDEARKLVEAHLLQCQECLRRYLDVKRSVETAEGAPGPSEAARVRLRSAVDEELNPQPRWSRWERPVAFAAAACIVIASGQAMRLLTSGRASPPYAIEHP